MKSESIANLVKVKRIQPGNTEKIQDEFYAVLMVQDQECDFFVDVSGYVRIGNITLPVKWSG